MVGALINKNTFEAIIREGHLLERALTRINGT